MARLTFLILNADIMIKAKSCGIVFLLILGTLSGCASFEQAETLCHILITNARITDGSGDASYIGYVAIRGDSIYEMGAGNPDHLETCQLIDAEGAVVAPGFIDLHAHGNPSETPEFRNFTSMGVTTITLGQDGGSAGVKRLAEWHDEYELEGLGTNLVMFYGHGTLREESGAGADRNLSASQLIRMDSLLAEAMAYSHGLSLGLEYHPGLYADSAELNHLAETTGHLGGIIMSHMRNEDDDSLRYSIEEMLELGRACPVHISHLKSVYGQGVARAEEVLTWLHDAADRGIQVTADIYPYTASYTGIAIVFPDWAKTEEQFRDAMENRREELEEFLRNKVISRNGPEATLLGTGEYAGLTLAEAASRENLSFTELLMKIGPQGASAAYFVMDEALQTRLLRDPLVGICSDGSPSGYHPRGHGTFARLIEKYVVKEKVLSMEEAVKKMTAFPASVLGLTDRGYLQPGMKADLIIFQPADVHETADFEDPFQLAEGFDFVMVNGKWIRQDGEFTEALTGRYILPEKEQQP